MREKGLFMKKKDFLSYVSPFMNPNNPAEFKELTQDGEVLR